MKIILRKIVFLLAVLLPFGCESAEDISYNMDHEVPMVVFSLESSEVERGVQHQIQIEVSDNVGLKSVDISYPDWNFQYSKKLNGEVRFTEMLSIDVPEDALLEWEEVKYRNDGSSYSEIERYHRFTVVSYDVNQNKRTSYFYMKVK